ncbi:GNAT family N-acetyltransferase [Oscillibacter valericigenes]|uniref:GNAT family N-acetyltransferase n=1 Tax=Oscillibacter valericigenes TaxID=351091 RepID=UPI001F3B522A|nr:GNAT family N-acetyltransferase [Oscillibacter valericigenes]MCF2616724.1 GNAT family N-acetyltransferase [Oscillibacter valericigenes]
MELRIPSPEQLRTVYDRDLKEAFPAAELKPLGNMERMWAEGWYRPWCLFDGDNIVGEAFLWLGHPGWALLDYLCVSAHSRNGGLGSVILQKLREREADTVIFGESEAPADAPDPEMAERRLGFYARNGLRMAGYDTEMFGVHYKTLYLAAGEVDEAELMRQHRFVYENTFAADKFHKYVRIPYDPDAAPGAKVPWQQ